MAATVEPMWTGATVVICASGPSLSAADTAHVQSRGVPVIAVNDAVRLVPWADVLYSSDRAWWAKRKIPPSFTGKKYSIGSRPGEADPVVNQPDVIVLRNSGVEGIDPAPDALRTGHNSGAAAINLAVHFGATRVLLLGYNLGRVLRSGHFHNEDYDDYSPFPMYVAAMRAMAAPLTAIGVRVVNCTTPSALDAFERGSLAGELP